MFRFGFKKTFTLKSRRKSDAEHQSAGEPVCGAYRVNADEFAGGISTAKRDTTPKVQTMYAQPQLKQSKSSNDIVTRAAPIDVRQSVPDIAQTETPILTNNQRKEKRRMDQKRLAEQKKQQKLAAEEHERQEKIKKEREKKEAKSQKNKPMKNIAPQTLHRIPQALQNYSINTPEILKVPPNYSINTLESSISRSSGPPPYSLEENLVQNTRDKSGNTSIPKETEDESSWDMILQHREHLKSSKPISGHSKQTHVDLRYNVVESSDHRENSEA